MKQAKIYAITHDPTGSRYVGSTLTAVFARIRSHLLLLNAGTHTSKKFQALWAKSTICDWSFKVLEVLENGRHNHRARLLAEKKWLDLVPPPQRLNDNTRFASYEKYSEVLRRIAKGERYVDIADAVGLSLGMISQIKQLRLAKII